MKIKLSGVLDVCLKHPGMWDDFARAGKETGIYLEISRADFDRINAKHFPGGAGTMLHSLLSPFVKVADAILGLDLGNCGSCAERELRLNSIDR